MTRPKHAALDATHASKCELAAEVLRSTGKLRLQVTGWSMLPTVIPGETLVVESFGDREISREVSRGDIVLFRREGRLFAHRVVATPSGSGEGEIVTRGDGMLHADSPLAASDVMGRVSCILRNGRSRKPSVRLSLSQRAVAAAVRRFDSAARFLVGVHQLRNSSRETSLSCRN
jgi:hypothetical protein